MGSKIYKKSNNAQNRNNKFNVEINNNQKNVQQKEIKNNVSDIQKKDKIIKNKKEEDNEIIIELEIEDNDGEEINILCDKNRLIEENKKYKKIIKNHLKYLITLIKKIQNYI